MRCLGCNYDLAGLRRGPCPECARLFDPANPATYRSRQHRDNAARAAQTGALALAITPWSVAILELLWGAAWAAHHRRWPTVLGTPSDDPADIPLASALYVLWALLLAASLVALPAATAAALLCTCRDWRRGLPTLLLALTLWAAGAVWIFFDPLRLGGWIMD